MGLSSCRISEGCRHSTCWLASHDVLFVDCLLKGETMEQCSFHLVPYFGECSSGVTLNFKFVFWELHETFPGFFNVAGLKFTKHFFF
jgi:hypothetical protein